MANKNFQIKANNGAGWDNLFPKTTIEQVENLQASLDSIDAVAKGAAKGKVFDTVAALDTWLSVAANKATLNIGDHLYIRATGVPDYWWDGTAKQEAETKKIVLNNASATEDGLMSKGDFSKLAGVATGATKVTAPSDIGAEPAISKKTAFNKDFETTVGNLKAPGTAAVGTSENIPRADHVHPAQTSVSGNAGTATTLATARTISIGTGATGTATSFNGSANITIPITALNADYLSSGIIPAARLSIPVVTASATAPTSPKNGDIWLDFSNN